MRRPATYDNPYRLDPNVSPTTYRLRLEPDLEAASFLGRVEIDLELSEATSTITLNAIELVVEPATLEDATTTRISAPARYDETYETVSFDFDEAVGPGAVSVAIEFSGALNDSLHGFYRSTYVDADGVTHQIATTQFESTDARRAFPCFDDPAQKATFEVTLVVPEGLGAFSNSAEVSSRPLDDARREVRFAPTMVMSTYLVAFVVGPFEATAERVVLGVPTRVVVPRGKKHLTDSALDALQHALEFFTEYFAVAYPGDKIDLIAIPDFASGAMENLGCITFREEYLLIDPASASDLEKLMVADVINHEVAHMWFGDLVTMEWWEGIWLNEAFATFMATICTDDYRPDWRRWMVFARERDAAFSVDAQHTTRPIEYRVVSPNECRGMFDVLTYQKGCSVLRMLEQYLGAETFRDGIRLYLSRHAYDNAVTADLWSALEETSGELVGDIMDTWIFQGVFPLLSLEGSTLSQSPFMYLAPSGSSNIGQSWKVPVLVRSLDSPELERVLLGERSETVSSSSPVVVNAGGSGFYRTAYDSTQLAQLAQRLGELDESERAVLVSDTWASILLGRLGVGDLLSLARGLVDFDEPAPWGVVSRALSLIDRIADDASRETLARVVRELMAPLYARLGWQARDAESSQVATLRASVLRDLGTIGRDESIAAEAARRFDADELAANLADAIVAITMHQSRPGDAETCRARRLGAATPQEEQRYLFAPAASRDPEVVLDAFERAFSEVRSAEAPYLIMFLMGNYEAGPEVWRRLRERWDEAIERFPESSHHRMVSTVSTFFTDAHLAAEARAFLEAHPVPTGQQSVAQSLDILDVNVALARRTAPSLRQVLSEFLGA